MHLVVKKAVRSGRVKDHHAFNDDNFIPKGERYLQIHNGTIGGGARSYNINREDAIKMLKELLTELEDEEECTECKECGCELTDREKDILIESCADCAQECLCSRCIGSR